MVSCRIQVSTGGSGGFDAEGRILRMYQIELGNVDWERDWTHRGLKAVYVHFLDCVFNYKRRVYYYQGRSEEEDQDEWAGKVPDRGMMKKQYVDARRFLRDCIVDKPQRGALFNAIFRDDGSLRTMVIYPVKTTEANVLLNACMSFWISSLILSTSGSPAQCIKGGVT